MSAPSFSKVNGGSAARIDCVNRAKGAALKPNKNQLRCHGKQKARGAPRLPKQTPFSLFFRFISFTFFLFLFFQDATLSMVFPSQIARSKARK